MSGIVLLSAQARQKAPPGSAAQLHPHSVALVQAKASGPERNEGGQRLGRRGSGCRNSGTAHSRNRGGRLQWGQEKSFMAKAWMWEMTRSNGRRGFRFRNRNGAPASALEANAPTAVSNRSQQRQHRPLVAICRNKRLIGGGFLGISQQITAALPV